MGENEMERLLLDKADKKDLRAGVKNLARTVERQDKAINEMMLDRRRLRDQLRSQDSVIIDQTQTIREQDQSILTLEKQNRLMRKLLMSLKTKSHSEGGDET